MAEENVIVECPETSNRDTLVTNQPKMPEGRKLLICRHVFLDTNCHYRCFDFLNWSERVAGAGVWDRHWGTLLRAPSRYLITEHLVRELANRLGPKRCKYSAGVNRRSGNGMILNIFDLVDYSTLDIEWYSTPSIKRLMMMGWVEGAKIIMSPA